MSRSVSFRLIVSAPVLLGLLLWSQAARAQDASSWWKIGSTQTPVRSRGAGAAHVAGPDFLARFPSDAVVAMVGDLGDGRHNYDVLVSFLQSDFTVSLSKLDDSADATAASRALDEVKKWETQHGISIRDDLFGSLSGQLGVFFRLPDVKLLMSDNNADAVKSTEGLGGLIAQLGNRPSLITFLSTMVSISGEGAHHEVAEGIDYFEWPISDDVPVSVVVGVSPNLVAIGLGRHMVDAMLRGPEPDGGLQRSTRFRNSVDHVQPGYEALLFVDGSKIRYAILSAEERAGAHIPRALMEFVKVGSSSSDPLVIGFYPEGRGLKTVAYGNELDAMGLLSGVVITSSLLPIGMLSQLQ